MRSARLSQQGFSAEHKVTASPPTPRPAGPGSVASAGPAAPLHALAPAWKVEPWPCPLGCVYTGGLHKPPAAVDLCTAVQGIPFKTRTCAMTACPALEGRTQKQALRLI